MIFRKKNILIVSPEPWSLMFVSKHHYAKILATLGNNVFFLNPPDGNTKNIEILPTDFHNVSVIKYKPIFKGLRFLPIFASKFCELIQKRAIEKKCNLKFDVIWSFEASRFFNFNIWGKKTIKILHIVDLNQDFQIKTAASTADICFCTTDFILQKLSYYNKKVFKINHGYNATEPSNPINLKGSIKAGYVGSLNIQYFDWKLALKIVDQSPEVDFYFIGPLKVEKLGAENYTIYQTLKGRRNSYFLGVVASHDIPNYLISLDVLLVLYKSQEHREQLANPHKIMEYLGSGKVIVATYTAEYTSLAIKNIIAMSEIRDDLPSRLKDVLSNLDLWNSDEKQRIRREFALNNSYEKQIHKIEQLLVNIVLN